MSKGKEMERELSTFAILWFMWPAFSRVSAFLGGESTSFWYRHRPRNECKNDTEWRPRTHPVMQRWKDNDIQQRNCFMGHRLLVVFKSTCWQVAPSAAFASEQVFGTFVSPGGIAEMTSIICSIFANTSEVMMSLSALHVFNPHWKGWRINAHRTNS